MDEIVKKRAEIRSRLPKNIQFSNVRSTDIESLVGLYDSVFFGGRIGRLLEAKNISLSFRVGHSNDLVLEDGGYVFSLNPSSVEHMQHSLKASPSTILQCLVEHQIVHLLTMICGQEEYPSDYHGPLFVKAAKKYFGHNFYKHDLGVSLSSRPYHKGVFVHRENSCYLNTLLITLLHNKSCFWRDRMLTKCPAHESLQGGWDHSIKSLKELQTHVSHFFDELQSSYSRLEEGKNIESSDIRTALQPFIPDLKDKRGKFDFYNVGAIYDTLCSLFPSLKFRCHDVVMKWSSRTKKHRPSKKIRTERKSAVTMWDFLDGYDNPGESYSRTMWELFSSPVLVFLNGGIPRIKFFSEEGIEEIEEDVFLTKVRAFKDTILAQGAYKLTGVITLQGVAPNREGGTHYVSHFLGENDEWYYYDDMGPVIKRVGPEGLPKRGIWTEEGGEMPAMFFYAKKNSLSK